MLLTKANLIVARTAYTGFDRGAMQCVKIHADGTTVATDGHMLVQVGSWPANATSGETPLDPCLLRAGDALELAKQVKKGAFELDVTATNSNGSITGKVGVATYVIPKAHDSTPLNVADYPNYAAVFPKEDPAVSPAFNIALLARLCAILKDAGVGVARFHLQADKNAPMHVVGTTADGQIVVALVMPCNLKD